ncbi:sensor histidine kinase [Caldanaerobius polysaccharolyticus]|uniref:sensor histidine kinase n=1 Tax=Caldanaerobius polysaccharolyticus TaxID=44256 RepID=UPI00047CCCCF|nr:HAMP domain-containing sensor histidine kinase [Caldanaerobius polysaccharolyticus]
MKQNSLFKRLMYVNMLLVFITILIVTGLLIQLFTGFYYSEKKDMLLEESRKLNNTFAAILVGNIIPGSLAYDLRFVDEYLNARIWLLDRRGVVYTVSTSQDRQAVGLKIPLNEVNEVLNGKVVVIKGSFGGMFKTPVLTVGSPVYFGNTIVGAIFMHAPIFEIQGALNRIYIIIAISALAGVAVAMLLSYLSAGRLSKPLVEISKAARNIAKGNFDIRVAVNSDDEIGQLARSFNTMANELEHLEEMRRGFVANVSHELRSPLTSIIGYLNGIIDGTIPEGDRDKYLKIVKSESERLSRLVSDLLNLAELEAGIKLNLRNFDINELIRRVLIKFSGKMDAKGLDAEVDFAKDYMYVEADPDRIEQVLINLLDNAIKFSKENGHIAIRTYQKDLSAYVSIEDNGIGIKEEDIPFIWDRFYKADKSRESKIEGTGLGLSIVKSIIESHGGDIYVESQYGKGTKFTFTLKIA